MYRRETPIQFTGGQLIFPVCRPVEIASSHHHILALRKCLWCTPGLTPPLVKGGRLYKVFVFFPPVLTDGSLAQCYTVCVYHTPPSPRGWLDCILISGHSYMFTQLEWRRPEPHISCTRSQHTQILTQTCCERKATTLWQDYWSEVTNYSKTQAHSQRFIQTSTVSSSTFFTEQ